MPLNNRPPRNVFAALLILYGVLNAVLYSALLPLWEGFDEPFHYCYVQSLSVERRFPVLGESACSQEVWQSLHLVPASHLVKRNIPSVFTFSDYFRLDASERRRLRAELAALPRGLKRVTEGGPLNYEAQQSPLAYAVLAAPDFLFRDMALPGRILSLRILGALIASVAIALLVFDLGRRLGLPEVFRHAAAFVTLSTQMFYAATAHITNDWLAVPLAVLFFTAAAALEKQPGSRRAILAAAVLSAGLMTKAYFLSLVPLAFGLVVWLAVKQRLRWKDAAVFFVIVLIVCGPWYARNVALYDSLSGTQQSASGLGLRAALPAAFEVDWGAAVVIMARQSLWTGNNSDTTFASATITLMWILLLLAGGCFAATALRRRLMAAEKLILAGAALFCAGIAYATALLHIYTEGLAKSTGQWYTQPFFAPLVCVAFGGLCRSGRFGRVIAALMVCLWGYVMAATYVAKLIPMYGGWEGPVRLASLAPWYASRSSEIAQTLADTAMAGPALLFVLAAAVGLASAAMPAAICRRLFLVADRKTAGAGVDELGRQ